MPPKEYEGFKLSAQSHLMKDPIHSDNVSEFALCLPLYAAVPEDDGYFCFLGTIYGAAFLMLASIEAWMDHKM